MTAQARTEATLGGDLDAVVDQLWRPALETGEVRVGTHELGAGWTTVESYRAIPSVRRARLLVPDASRRLATRAVGNYRALLTRPAHARRTLLTAGTALGLGLVSERVVVQVSGPDPTAPLTPLTWLRDRLGTTDLHAALRVNLNTNRKATLQLLDGRGAPRGLAKFAWEPVSTEGVRREAAALRALDGQLQHTRVPTLLLEDTHHGRPVVVADALPPDVRGSGPRKQPPTPIEVHDLFTTVRRAPFAEAGSVRALAARLDALLAAHPDDHSLAAARDLLSVATTSDLVTPVVSRWHGDFTPWNAARDASGTLWIWDWETSEPDAPAGLDALHWALGVREEEHGERWDGHTLRRALADAGPMLRALGVGRALWPALVAVHVAALAERVLAHALGHGGWQDSWMPRSSLDDILRSARDLALDPVVAP